MRLFTVQVPLSGVAPILVHAAPIGESNDTDVLAKLSEDIIRGLISSGIKVSSYSCDGTESERKVERILCQRADEHITYTIPSPYGKEYEITITIAIFAGCPVVMLQDSKHGLKTFRNNLFAGARLLVLGNAAALYRHIHKLASHPDSPLYQRDVEKVDRQDDNAATHLFSSRALDHLVHHFPNFLGEIIYLFIFGELIDAYQNREISLIERFKLILRAHYFLCMWKKFLHTSGYPQSRFFISREASDIARILIEGLAGLIFVYRDYYSSDTEVFPLLPWLHSTEACEHVFGSARHLIKDFAMLDFFYMARKLRFQVRESVLVAECSNPKDRASGYHHSYFDTRGANLSMLSTFVLDTDLPDIAGIAMEEAESLISFLGLAPACLHEFTDTDVPPTGPSTEEDEEVEENEEISTHAQDDDPNDLSAGTELRDLLHSPWVMRASTNTGFTKTECSRLNNLASAAAALLIDDTLKV